MRALLAVLLWLVPAVAVGQTCTPVLKNANTPMSNAPENPGVEGQKQWHVFTEPVPAGQVWKMRGVSVSIWGDTTPKQYVLQHANAYAYMRIKGEIGIGTPVLGLTPEESAALILLPGEKLGARVTSHWDLFGPDSAMAVYFSAWVYPEACLPMLRGDVALAGGAMPPPDFSALIAAALAAASSLHTLANSVP